MKSEDLLNEYRDTELRRFLAPYTVKRRGREIERFLEHLKSGPASATREDVEGYLEGSVTDRAHNDALRTLKHFYGFLIKREMLLTDPCAGMEYRPRQGPSRGATFTEDEIRKLLATCHRDTHLDLRDRAIMTLFYATALRLSELSALSVYDADLRRCELLVRRGKGGKERCVPLGVTAAEALDAYLERRLRLRAHDSETLFLNAHGKPFTAAGIEKMLERRKRKAGIRKGGLAHAFRHACAGDMLKGGAPLASVRKMLGHARIETTARYTYVMKETLSKIHAAAHPKAKEAE